MVGICRSTREGEYGKGIPEKENYDQSFAQPRHLLVMVGMNEVQDGREIDKLDKNLH